MYYSYPCPYCGKIFYAFGDDKNQTIKVLFTGIKKHLVDYGEDKEEYKFINEEENEENEMYSEISGTPEAPSGGYQVE